MWQNNNLEPKLFSCLCSVINKKFSVSFNNSWGLMFLCVCVCVCLCVCVCIMLLHVSTYTHKLGLAFLCPLFLHLVWHWAFAAVSHCHRDQNTHTHTHTHTGVLSQFKTCTMWEYKLMLLMFTSKGKTELAFAEMRVSVMSKNNATFVINRSAV